MSQRGLLGGGTKKILAASIEEGKITYTEVLVLAKEKRVVDRDDDNPELNTLKYFYKVADLNGNVIREDVPALMLKTSTLAWISGGQSITAALPRQ